MTPVSDSIPPVSRPTHGTPPRAIWGPSAGEVLPYASARRGREWMLLPDTLASRAAQVLRVAAVVAIATAIVLAAFAHDEYERATQRLTMPFDEVFEVGWNRRAYVIERRQAALDRLRHSGYLAAGGAVALAGGVAYEWRRRRRGLR